MRTSGRCAYVVREIRGEKTVADRLRDRRQLRAERQQQRDLMHRLVALRFERAMRVRLHGSDRMTGAQQLASERLALAAQGLLDPGPQRVVGGQRIDTRLQRIRIQRRERIDELLAVLFAVGVAEITIELRARARRRERIAEGEVGARAKARARARAG